MKALSKRRIKVDMRVIDSSGMIGTVKEKDESHNIYVEYDKGKGSGLYCVLPTCKEYDPLYELFEHEKAQNRFNKRTVEALGPAEQKRLRIRYEARKEPLKQTARAFNIGVGTLVAYARANKWKLPKGRGKVYVYEKR